MDWGATFAVLSALTWTAPRDYDGPLAVDGADAGPPIEIMRETGTTPRPPVPTPVTPPTERPTDPVVDRNAPGYATGAGMLTGGIAAGVAGLGMIVAGAVLVQQGGRTALEHEGGAAFGFGALTTMASIPMLVLGTRARRRFVAMQAGSGWTPPESGAGQRVGGVVLTGVGAGGILVGSAVGIANAIGYRPADPMESDAARRTRQLRTRALIGGLAVGGAAAVATGVILLWRGRRRARAHQEAWRARAAALVPTIAATGRTAIVGLAGRW